MNSSTARGRKDGNIRLSKSHFFAPNDAAVEGSSHTKPEDLSSDSGMASTAKGQRVSESKLPKANVPKSKKNKRQGTKTEEKRIATSLPDMEGPNHTKEEDISSDDDSLGPLKPYNGAPTPEEVAEYSKLTFDQDAKLAELCKRLGHESPCSACDDIGRPRQHPFFQPVTSDSDEEEELWQELRTHTLKHPNSYF